VKEIEMTKHLRHPLTFVVLLGILSGCEPGSPNNSGAEPNETPTTIFVTVHRNGPKKFTVKEPKQIRAFWRFILDRSYDNSSARKEWKSMAAVGHQSDGDMRYIQLDYFNETWRDSEGNGGKMPEGFPEFFDRLVKENLPDSD
jgi:hypothetical protein